MGPRPFKSALDEPDNAIPLGDAPERERVTERDRVLKDALELGSRKASTGNSTRIFWLFAEVRSFCLHHVIADADALPLRAEAVDFITLLETLEHLRPPTKVGREIMCTLKSGGMCMLTTPARLRYLFKPDPHYGIRSLLLLPDPLQAWVARRLEIEGYDVTHTFWHVREIARLFPGEKNIEVLWDKLPPFPDSLRTRLWWAFRNMLWSRLIFRKNDR